jgi:hypothetical protein
LQCRGGLPGVGVAAVSCRVAHCLIRLSFNLIWLQSHPLELCSEPWHDVVERWGRWLWKEVGSAEDYIVSYKSKWNERLPTFTFNSCGILLGIGALSITEGDSNSRAIYSKSTRYCLFVYRNTSRWTTADMSCLIGIKQTFFDGKDVCWCWFQDIAAILHESHANYPVIMYC